MHTRRAGRQILWAIAITIVLGACATSTTPSATAPPATTLPPARAIQQEDVASLAGVWEGTSRTPTFGLVEIRTTIKPDGTFISAARSGEGATPGRLWVIDGKILYETAYSIGTMTFHEGGGTRILRWQGAARVGGGPVVVEITQKK